MPKECAPMAVSHIYSGENRYENELLEERMWENVGKFDNA